MAGGTADWSGGTAQTIYTAAPNINGFVLMGAYGRSYTGTQPLTIQLKVGGANWGGALTVVSLLTNGVFVLPISSGLAPMLLASQIIQVVPLLPSAGTMTFDIVGYSF